MQREYFSTRNGLQLGFEFYKVKYKVKFKKWNEEALK